MPIRVAQRNTFWKCHPPKVLFCAFCFQHHPKFVCFRGLLLDDFGENTVFRTWCTYMCSEIIEILDLGTLQCTLPIYGLYGFILCCLILAAKKHIFDPKTPRFFNLKKCLQRLKCSHKHASNNQTISPSFVTVHIDYQALLRLPS